MKLKEKITQIIIAVVISGRLSPMNGSYRGLFWDSQGFCSAQYIPENIHHYLYQCLSGQVPGPEILSGTSRGSKNQNQRIVTRVQLLHGIPLSAPELNPIG